MAPPNNPLLKKIQRNASNLLISYISTKANTWYSTQGDGLASTRFSYRHGGKGRLGSRGVPGHLQHHPLGFPLLISPCPSHPPSLLQPDHPTFQSGSGADKREHHCLHMSGENPSLRHCGSMGSATLVWPPLDRLLVANDRICLKHKRSWCQGRDRQGLSGLCPSSWAPNWNVFFGVLALVA